LISIYCSIIGVIPPAAAGIGVIPPVLAGYGVACPALSGAEAPAKAALSMGVTSFTAKLLFGPMR
jgi:hypothetical protein